MAAGLTIAEPASADLGDVRAMLQEYVDGLGIDLSFQGFARELAGLPGDYAPPAGGLLIARVDGHPAGMVAFRGAETAAEMKRLFVRPTVRGAGVGRALVIAVLDAARRAGYETMVLDTLPVMQSAQRLYEQLGFRDTPPYYQSPVPGTRYMALRL